MSESKEMFTPDDYQGWLSGKKDRSHLTTNEQLPESKEQWTQRQQDEDTAFARRIMVEQPDLRIKRMLDARRKQSRWAIGFHSAARLLGVDPATLRKVCDDPYQVHLEQIRPLGGKGHRYVWLSDVLEYAKHMSEPERLQ